MDTRFVQFIVDPSTLEQERDNLPNSELTIRFIRNLKFCDLASRSQAELEQWVSALSSIMIGTDFHSKFNSIRQLGEGSFAKVYQVENILTGINYAVKAFSKEVIKSQSNGKKALINELDVLYALDHPTS